MPWYVKFDGIHGSSSKRNHVHWIDAATVTMGSVKAGGGSSSVGTGYGRGGGKMRLDDVSIGILNDIGTPRLLEAAVKGKVFKKVEIHGTANYGDAGEQVYLNVELENVLISSYQLGVLDNNAATDDISLSLNFEKIKTTYTQYGRDGSKGGNVESGWQDE